MHPLAQRLTDRFGDDITAVVEYRGDLAVSVRTPALYAVAEHLRTEPDLAFDYIVHVSSVDFPSEKPRFEVVYEIYSIHRRERVRLKTRVGEEDAVLPSLCALWAGANFMEREVYDMMGIRFRGHPDLRRILLPDEYDEGFPLRKDFPVRGRGWRDTFEFLEKPASPQPDRQAGAGGPAEQAEN